MKEWFIGIFKAYKCPVSDSFPTIPVQLTDAFLGQILFSRAFCNLRSDLSLRSNRLGYGVMIKPFQIHLEYSNKKTCKIQQTIRCFNFFVIQLGLIKTVQIIEKSDLIFFLSFHLKENHKNSEVKFEDGSKKKLFCLIIALMIF